MPANRAKKTRIKEVSEEACLIFPGFRLAPANHGRATDLSHVLCVLASLRESSSTPSGRGKMIQGFFMNCPWLQPGEHRSKDSRALAQSLPKHRIATSLNGSAKAGSFLVSCPRSKERGNSKEHADAGRSAASKFQISRCETHVSTSYAKCQRNIFRSECPRFSERRRRRKAR